MSNNASSSAPLPNGAIVPQQQQQPSRQEGEDFEQEHLPQQTGPPLADLLVQIEDYNPTIPDSVTQYYLSTAGVQTDDPRIVKLVSAIDAKIISEVITK